MPRRNSSSAACVKVDVKMKTCAALLLAAVVLAGCTGEPAREVEVAPPPSAAADPGTTLESRLERFVGEDASDAYFKLRELGYRVRFGPKISNGERANVMGIQTHPDVDITEMVLKGNVVTILDVECYAEPVC